MGVARTRPSRIVSQVILTNTDLPNAAGQKLTWSIPNLPIRGIVHRVSMRLVYNTGFTSVTEFDPIYVHTVGPTGPNATTVNGAKSIIAQYGLDLASTTAAGSQELFTTGAAIYMPTLNLVAGSGSAVFASNKGSNSFFYDLSNQLKGPNVSEGELFFTWISDNTNYQTNVVQVGCRVEIEPCF